MGFWMFCKSSAVGGSKDRSRISSLEMSSGLYAVAVELGAVAFRESLSPEPFALADFFLRQQIRDIVVNRDLCPRAANQS